VAVSVMLHIDTSDLDSTVTALRGTLTPDQMRTLLRRVLAPSRVGSHVRTTLKKELPVDYCAKPAWIGSTIQTATSSGGMEINCTIPVAGTRGKIGGQFAASATAGGSKIRSGYEGAKGKRKRRAYKIVANIVTEGASVLPSDGGAIHFAVFKGKKKGFYARIPGDGNRVRPAVGIGVPQMPTNRSRQNVSDEIVNYLKQRIEHEYRFMMGRIR